MTKKDYSNVIILILVLLLGFILFYPSFVITEVESALSVFITKYFPAVFPIYIITDLLIHYHFPEKLAQKLDFFCRKVLHCDGSCAFVILISMISGFPSGARCTNELLEEGTISTNMANYLISFTHFSNPLYILGTCFLMTKNRVLTICILFCHFFANFVIAFIVRPKSIEKTKNEPVTIRPISFVNALSNSILNTFQLMFLLLGTSILFFVLSGIFSLLLQNNPYQYLITGIFELSKGILSMPASLSVTGQGIVILLFLSFGSFSVHMQVLSIIKDTTIKYRNFLLGRISQVAISIFLFILLTILGFI